MLDKVSFAFLSFIVDRCSLGEYKVFSEEDFLSVVRSGKIKIGDVLNKLYEEGYIGLKYADEKMYCVCPLPLGWNYKGREKEKKSEYKWQFVRIALLSALGSFLGSLSGVLLFYVLRYGW